MQAKKAQTKMPVVEKIPTISFALKTSIGFVPICESKGFRIPTQTTNTNINAAPRPAQRRMIVGSPGSIFPRTTM